ncbi:hypothetical protein N7520_010091 [Penicillium odoratum]|uniref:uncharacterized protein n=1 Tax=Penicillium odoratum TaxID=1167516 RepID=UPI00254672CE|nr:uncharacterized protein N7520_010091 [Penicillium odoratum]KAJ5753174.1 hypothetical protein N7520_010091 [Penicillium odoratum]
MASATTIFRLFAFSVAFRQATAAFSLDTSGPSWDYTTKDLADTTSQACKDAYSASINCDDTLLKLVASMDPDFDPQASDFEAMCTTTCSDSLTQYIKNVNAACNKDGDLAGLADGNSLDYSAPVATVGEVFQYKYSQGCAKSGSEYCFLSNEDSTNFPCDDECAVQFYQNAHEQPGSGYFFSYFVIGTQSSWWEENFASGWKRVVQCGDGGSNATSVSTSASSTNTDAASTTSSTGSTDGKAAISTTTTSTKAMTTAASTRSASEATSSTATSGASRLRAPFLLF